MLTLFTQAQLYTILELCRAFDKIFKEHLEGGYVSCFAFCLSFPTAASSMFANDSHMFGVVSIFVHNGMVHSWQLRVLVFKVSILYVVVESNQLPVNISSRPGGDRIYGVFDNQLPAALRKLPFDRHLSVQNVRKIVSEADGYQPHLIAPEQGYRRLIEGSLNYFRGPAEASVDAVSSSVANVM